MKKKMSMIAFLVAVSPLLYSFCGFYVSKADGTLKNKTSQVILVRDGNKTVITMYNDYKGDIKDFAMVVPVPVVLKKDDIHVVDQSIFQKLNDYSAPRLVEYYDQNPCNRYDEVLMDVSVKSAPQMRGMASMTESKTKDLGVKVEAKYLVGEYDILILSAKESGGLKEWLTINGYKIPAGAEEVLDPYIKSNLKFFVVKVNEAEKKKLPGNFLRPLQIAFNSPKFMLPIRLGMANADGDQDLIVYAFTRKGRVECTNYRNVNIPTGKNIPLFVKKDFGVFYNNLFNRQWQNENKSIGFLEYAWDVSPTNYVKCDPCVGNPPNQQDIVQSGVWWLQKDWSDYSDVDNQDEDYMDTKVHFTRLHFRYNRQSFPQDLMFQVTPNTENFQARYIITHPATGEFTCDEGKKYLKDLKLRRKKELVELAGLTGTTLDNWQQDLSASKEEGLEQEAQYASLVPAAESDMNNRKELPGQLALASAVLMGAVGFFRWKRMI